MMREALTSSSSFSHAMAAGGCIANLQVTEPNMHLLPSKALDLQLGNAVCLTFSCFILDFRSALINASNSGWPLSALA